MRKIGKKSLFAVNNFKGNQDKYDLTQLKYIIKRILLRSLAKFLTKVIQLIFTHIEIYTISALMYV